MNPIIVTLLEESLPLIGVKNLSTAELEASLAPAPSPELGDVACNLSFRLAKQLKKSPLQIAEGLAAAVFKQHQTRKLTILAKVEAAAPGFVNFFYNKGIFTLRALEEIIAAGDSYGSSQHGKGKKIVIEHTAINPCKPLHIGHLRNAILGDVMARLHHRTGWAVEVQNLIDDLGRQVATLVWGIQKKLHRRQPRDSRIKYDLWLGQIYSIAANALKETPDLEHEVDSLMEEAKTSDATFGAIRMLAEKCVEVNLQTCWRMGICYDTLVWESDISRSGVWEDTFSTLKQNPNFEFVREGEKKGCFIAKLEGLPEFLGEKDANKILVRSNGVPTYNAHDIALQMWKFGLSKADLRFKLWCTQFKNRDLWSSTPYIGETVSKRGKAHRVINVIGYEQNYLQKVLKTCFKLLNFQEQYENSVHLSYKHVRLPGERFSGRTGNWFETRAWADAVIEDVKEIACQYLNEKRSELPDQTRADIAEAIAIGTIRYWLVKFNTEQTIVFDRELATRLEGDAGPFIMYSYVRGRKILQKAQGGEGRSENPESASMIEDETFALIKSLQEFPTVVQAAAEQFQPSLVTAYAFRLATEFNRFYTKCPVLSAAPPTRSLRLKVVEAFCQVLKNTLEILGIPPIEEM